MTEIQSYIFDFNRVPDFMWHWNNRFHATEMDGENNNFQFVFSSYTPTNIEECLNGDVLDTSTVPTATSYVFDCKLEFDGSIIRVASDVNWSIGSSIIQLKAVFVRHKATGCVMGYSINTDVPFEVTNQVKIEKDSILWSFEDG